MSPEDHERESEANDEPTFKEANTTMMTVSSAQFKEWPRSPLNERSYYSDQYSTHRTMMKTRDNRWDEEHTPENYDKGGQAARNISDEEREGQLKMNAQISKSQNTKHKHKLSVIIHFLSQNA